MVYMTFSKFTDSTFTEKFNTNEFPLKLKNIKKLFFGIDLVASRKDLKIVLQNCYVTPTTNKMSPIYFVKNR